MFDVLKAAVAANFKTLAKNDLFVVEYVKDELFQAYLAAFPENERQEHNCNCCKAFFNHYGGIVSIEGGKIRTVWDVKAPDEYAAAIAAVKAIVLSKAIDAPFLSKFAKLGTDSNVALLADGKTKRWTHFFVELPKDKVNRSDATIASIRGAQVTTKDVFSRALETITNEAVEIVNDLIEQNSLYRGAEFKDQVKRFAKQKADYTALPDAASKSLFAWSNYKEGGKIRNTAIGTLLVDLSPGVDENKQVTQPLELENAVRKFEAVMAPSNYRRSTALITPKMIAAAQEQLQKAGFSESVKRRHATPDDIPLEHLLFVNRDSTSTDDVFAQMATGAVAKVPKTIKEVTVDEFVKTVLKDASNVQLFLENGQNFMSLIAPVNPEAPTLLSWGNGISWTYQNNQTDVIKEKVKKAGGKVVGELRASLEWFNYDDLDLHLTDPRGHEICFRNKVDRVSGGNLDVDMNISDGHSRTPVENIVFPEASTMAEGKYTVTVQNFTKRENVDLGFNAQIECKGVVYNLSHPRAVSSREFVEIATFEYTRKDGIKNLKTKLATSQIGREVAGLSTNNLQKVNMITFSPNHWGEAQGNKHLFVILDGAKIDEPLRPFFNEYLRSELMDHRKVMEVLGNKLMIEPTEQQVSGVGISLTQVGSSLTFKVDNKFVKVVI